MQKEHKKDERQDAFILAACSQIIYYVLTKSESIFSGSWTGLIG